MAISWIIGDGHYSIKIINDNDNQFLILYMPEDLNCK